jgi:CheY-like chemotaxis protein
VAHDFNNLLSVILAHVDFLSDQLEPGGEPRQEMEGIQRAAQRGAALTRQLLLFSRHKPLEPSQLDLNQVVSEVNKLLSRVIGEPVRIATALEPHLWPVRADADQLAQVVLNLAVNARDAMPRGGELRISTGNLVVSQHRHLRGGELPPGRYVRLMVRDEGVGMGPEVLARLFEPFFTTKEQGKGTGLGLATLYGIVQGSNGAVEVESEPGKGSTFSVYLPATEAQAAELPARPQQHGAGRGETVLVVEDEEPLRALVRRILSANGYAVLEGANGQDALRALQVHGGRIDLLITDVVMPEMNGRELAERLVRERPGVRILYMTGYTDAAVPEASPSTGFIQKPFATSAFLSEVRRLLDGL